MNPVYEAALRRELAGLERSPDRPAKARRIAEVKAQLGEPAPTDEGVESDDATPAKKTATPRTERRSS